MWSLWKLKFIYCAPYRYSLYYSIYSIIYTDTEQPQVYAMIFYTSICLVYCIYIHMYIRMYACPYICSYMYIYIKLILLIANLGLASTSWGLLCSGSVITRLTGRHHNQIIPSSSSCFPNSHTMHSTIKM